MDLEQKSSVYLAYYAIDEILWYSSLFNPESNCLVIDKYTIFLPHMTISYHLNKIVVQILCCIVLWAWVYGIFFFILIMNPCI